MSKGFQLIRADESITERPLIFTIFGQPGIGKTSLSFTMPGPVLFMDFDRGLTRAVQQSRPDSFSVSDFGAFWEHVQSEQFQIDVEEGNYQSFVVDTVGAMLDDYAASYLISMDRKNGNAAGGLSLQGWGALGNLFNKLRARLQSLDLHLCLVSHAKDAGEDAVVRMDLAIKGGSSDIVTRISDQIGFVWMEGKNRVIEFTPSQMHLGKDTAAVGKVAIPDAADIKYQTFFSDIVTRVNAKMASETEAQIAAKAKIAAYRNEISECKTPEQFTALSERVATEGATVRVQLKQLLSAQMKAQGVEYNKEAKAFQKVPANVEG